MKIQRFNEKVSNIPTKEELSSAVTQIKNIWYDLHKNLETIRLKFSKYVESNDLAFYDRDDEVYLPTSVYIKRFTKQSPILIFRDNRTGRDIKLKDVKDIKSLYDIHKNTPDEFMRIYKEYEYNEEYDDFFSKFSLVELYKDTKKYNL